MDIGTVSHRLGSLYGRDIDAMVDLTRIFLFSVKRSSGEVLFPHGPMEYVS